MSRRRPIGDDDALLAFVLALVFLALFAGVAALTAWRADV